MPDALRQATLAKVPEPKQRQQAFYLSYYTVSGKAAGCKVSGKAAGCKVSGQAAGLSLCLGSVDFLRWVRVVVVDGG